MDKEQAFRVYRENLDKINGLMKNGEYRKALNEIIETFIILKGFDEFSEERLSLGGLHIACYKGLNEWSNALKAALDMHQVAISQKNIQYSKIISRELYEIYTKLDEINPDADKKVEINAKNAKSIAEKRFFIKILTFKAQVFIDNKNFKVAEHLLKKAQKLYRKHKIKDGIAEVTITQGVMMISLEKFDRATNYLLKARTLYEEMGAQWFQRIQFCNYYLKTIRDIRSKKTF